MGKYARAIRLVANIDTALGPDEVLVPWNVYKQMNCSQWGLINRAPSINTECAFVVRIYPDKNISTVKVSAFVADKKHLDQDGDEINLFYIELHQNFQSKDFLIAEMELLRASFTFGRRCTMNYQPKYTFGQYYDYMMFLDEHKEFMNNIIPFYSELPVERKKKPMFLMNLICSIFYKIGVSLMSKIIKYFETAIVPTPHLKDVIEGNLKEIFESGSKGSEAHQEQYLKYMHGMDPEEWHKDAINQFNHYISASDKVSNDGRNLFTHLCAFLNLSIQADQLLYDNEVVIMNFSKNPLTFSIQYNLCSIQYMSLALEKTKTKDQMSVEEFKNEYFDSFEIEDFFKETTTNHNEILIEEKITKVKKRGKKK